MTAGHCEPLANINQYQEPIVPPNPPPIPYAIGVALGGYQLEDGNLGDFGWYRTSHEHFAQFYIGNTALRTVNSVRSQFAYGENDFIRVFGRASFDAGLQMPRQVQVERASWGCPGVGVDLVRMNAWVTIEGDSGAPWYLGNVAYGVHTGRCFNENGNLRSVFSKAGYLDATPIGVDIMARDRKVRGERLCCNNQIQSPNTWYRLVMQSDGNLVLYGPSGQACPNGVCWVAPVPTLAGTFAKMQSDGKFALYSSSGVFRWSTPTGGPIGVGHKIIMQNDGNLVVYATNEMPLWDRYS